MAAEGDIFVYEGAELVFGIVAPVGTDLDRFIEILTVELRRFKYDVNVVRLSELAVSFLGKRAPDPATEGAATRISRLMDAGNAVRAIGGGDALARATAVTINGGRARDPDGTVLPFLKKAHVLRSLKHPDEVRTMRRVYGPGFFLIGVVASSDERRDFLMTRRGCTSAEVDRLFARDEAEDDVKGELGQRTRDTFHLSDVFLQIDDKPGLARFLGLAFGNPFETPSRDEYAMFLAFSAAVRSGDLSRQVGAVIVSSAGDVVAIGTNEVPVAGGGLCWPGPLDDRDLHRGGDTNEQQRAEIVDEILTALKPPNVAMREWKATGWRKLKQKHAKVMDITEYGRAVHAEMEALLSCARAGISPMGATLFSTTFPCHNCAKHVLASGVTRVVYVEPYPKSQAAMMYGPSIRLSRSGDERSVLFEPFIGLGPRKFFDLFSMTLSSGYALKRKQDGRKRSWEPETATVRVPMVGGSYLTREASTAEMLLDLSTRRTQSRRRKQSPRKRSRT